MNTLIQPTAITGANTQFGYLHHQLIYPIKIHPHFEWVIR